MDAKMPGVAVRIGGQAPAFREAPAYGADTRALLREAGLAEPEIDRLVASKVALEAAS
jgi:crotonobetainyl-CoA:carnitine CoA-transferase CaiB-like acyl-CoA transferase